MAKFIPWGRRAAAKAPTNIVALPQALRTDLQTPAGQLGMLIGVGFVALIERREKRREVNARFLKRWNQKAKDSQPLWTVVAALAGIASTGIAFVAFLVG